MWSLLTQAGLSFRDVIVVQKSKSRCMKSICKCKVKCNVQDWILSIMNALVYRIGNKYQTILGHSLLYFTKEIEQGGT